MWKTEERLMDRSIVSSRFVYVFVELRNFFEERIKKSMDKCIYVFVLF